MEKVSGKIDSLQALRAVAALFVMFFHGTGLMSKLGYLFLNNIFCIGFAGVDIFFVISGFVIYHSCLGKKYSPAYFLKKRFIRIYPVYWLFAALPLLGYMISPGVESSSKANIAVIVKSMLLLPQEKPLLLFSWTLTYEIIFYIVFAYSFLKKAVYLFWVLVGWVTIILLVNITGLTSGIFAVDMLTKPIIINFALGCAVAYYYIKCPAFRYYRLFIIAGLGYFLISWIFYYQTRMYLVNNKLVRQFSPVYMFGIPAAIFMFGILYSKIHVNKLLVRVGDASYSLYLLHGMAIFRLRALIVVLGAQNYFNGFTGSIVVYIATVAIAYFFYVLVEKPLLLLLNRYVLKRRTTALPNN